MDYRNSHTFENRQDEAKKVLKKYPDRVPVILEKSKNSNLNELQKNKYLVPKNMNMGEFLRILRKKIKLEPEHSMILFINNTIPTTSDLISQVYEQQKNQDEFLYITYACENTFG